MKKTVLAVLVTLALFLTPLAAWAAPIITMETQFNYTQSNPAWLKGLTVKENMVSPTELSNSVMLEAMPDYPYSKTPEGFRSDVEYYTRMFSLDENSQRAAYIYVLRYINAFADEATRNVSDEYIKNTLTSMGIVYPEGGMGDYENLIFARSLYTLLCSGAVKLDVTPGMTVQQALVKCLTQTMNIDEQALNAWSLSTVATLDDYVLVASKVALNSQGYAVRPDTPPEEVYRLIAVMTIRQLGISIDENTADFDELKLKYLAALLSTHYNVSIAPAELKKAQANGNIPFYLLQLIGKKYGVTVRGDMGYSEAFNLVASNSDYFNLEEGEFYADIYRYAAYLEYKRDRIWVCPQVYRTTTATDYVSVTVNGKSAVSGEYSEVALDKTKESQEIAVTVRFVSASQDTSQTYRITVHQGKYEASSSGSPTPSVTVDPNSDFTVPTTGITDPAVAGDAALKGLTGTLSEAAVQANIPSRITNILTLMSPAAETAQPNAGSGVSSILSGVSSTPAAENGAPTQTSPDYLSQLMGGSYSLGSGSVSSPSGGQSGTPAPTPAAQTPAQTAPSPGAYDTPMLVSQAGAPPEGYEYVVNDEGYITGITLKKTYSPAAAPLTSSQSAAPASSRSPLKTAIPAIAIGVVAALCGGTMVFLKRRRAGR